MGLCERGICIGVLFNIIWLRREHEWIFECDDVLAFIDGSVYMFEILWMKPHFEVFRVVMAVVGIDDPACIVFVGDRLFDDIHGAKVVGMKVVFVLYSTIFEY